ncbi:MAG: 2-oxoacid:ferredoxin oxidoreductase subunit alpha [Deltaproteobacteria bacterium RIFOXYD12_FULL_57_12]|nr:MAG: 2-oxoacid:ferredoxin oxidoreductase subunit alpha [Deltaproteobacteria bacterium RIFOXYD12_FULL_57_12]
MDYSIKIGGEAGQGIQTIGDALGRVFVRAGYHVFSHQDYESRIRGGHNFYQLRFSSQPLAASRNKVDILVALDRESITRHEKDLTVNGRIIYDASALKFKNGGPAFLDIPFEKLALEQDGDKIMVNTVATGAVLGMLGLEPDLILELIADTFKNKGDHVVHANKNAVRAGYEYARLHCDTCTFAVAVDEVQQRMLVGGVESIALGALASGCRFYSAYPMTPSTGIMNYLASTESEYGVIVEQAEDEIAAINMALGASYAGVRAMTGTSGGGFALMVEGLSLAGMTETPIVIAMGQRPGPATGLPTRTEQGDLEFLLSAGHGEFPRVIFAPGTPRQAFHLTNKAFDIAEKYQIPVFILFDTYLADSQWTVDSFDLNQVRYIDYRLRGDAFKNQQHYRRYAYTETGISPLAVPGDASHVVVVDSDEHDEEGHIIEDAATRIRMVEKRLLKKLPLIRTEIAPPDFYGDQEAHVVLTGWGSTYGIIKEAVDELAKSMSIAMLHFSEVFPLPDLGLFDYVSFLRKTKLPLCIEHNATGQFSRLLRAATGFEFKIQINKYDGRPFTVEELIGEVHDRLGNI